ncbi:hypothetical protein CPC08DRAFT_770111 [Agrocybe pediades]|nr:hypothetical protein CPC08DRAFT_770111 [Agrocybe pediades]
MELASQITTVGSFPFQVAPAVGPIATLFLKFHPPTQVKKWSKRATEIMALVSEWDENIPSHVMEFFINVCEGYIAARNEYLKTVKHGSLSHWNGEGRKQCKKLLHNARATVHNGERLSNQAFLAKKRCDLDHKYVPRNAEKKCPICFPANLSSISQERKRLPDSYYTSDWLEIIEVIKATKANLDKENDQQSALPAPPEQSLSPTGASSQSHPVAPSSLTPENEQNIASKNIASSPPTPSASIALQVKDSACHSASSSMHAGGVLEKEDSASSCPPDQTVEGISKEQVSALYSICFNPFKDPTEEGGGSAASWELETRTFDGKLRPSDNSLEEN